MKDISLTKGYVAIVDNEDFERISKYKWHSLFDKSGNVYAVTGDRYKKGYNGQRKIRMHRFILNIDRFNHNKVDHIDRNTLNNRKSNLRIANSSQNARNQSITKRNTSGFKGVVWHKRDQCYQVSIVINRVTKYLGYFEDIVEAAKAYDNAAIELHGEYACTNKMLGLY